MGEIPEYKVVEEAKKTHKALEKLSPEDRITIQTHALGSLRALIANKEVAPETVATAARKYYRKHPKLEKPLEWLEKLVKEG
jgi:hypothetical protein